MYESMHARHLINKGFSGNGCGSNLISKFACFILVRPLGAKVLKELKECWLIHDAEYTIPTALKTTEHKNESDSNLDLNIKAVFLNNCIETKYSKILGKLIYTALIWGGDEAYYTKKGSGTGISSITTMATVTIVIVAIAKYFGLV